MKKFIFFTAVIAVFLTSCAKDGYTDSISCRDIVNTVIIETADSEKEYAPFETSHIAQYFKETDKCDDYCAVYSTDTSDIDEIGIFHTSSKDNADALVKDCQSYIEELQENSRAFIASYAPEELPKLDGAQVRRFGNYVIYTVLEEEHADEIFEQIKERLIVTAD